jgi:transposase
MRRISTSKAFARQVTDTLSGKVRWPLTPEQRARIAADLAEAASQPSAADAYSRHLASGEDWLSRKRREHPEAFANEED